MDHLVIWRLAQTLKQCNIGPIKHQTPVPHYDEWRDTMEGELAFALLFATKKEHDVGGSVSSSRVTRHFVLRFDGFYLKQFSWDAPDAATYTSANEGDDDLNIEKLKQSVVAEIREKVDRHVAGFISYRLLKQYRDREAEYDRTFGTQDY